MLQLQSQRHQISFKEFREKHVNAVYGRHTGTLKRKRIFWCVHLLLRCGRKHIMFLSCSESRDKTCRFFPTHQHPDKSSWVSNYRHVIYRLLDLLIKFGGPKSLEAGRTKNRWDFRSAEGQKTTNAQKKEHKQEPQLNWQKQSKRHQDKDVEHNCIRNRRRSHK